MISALTETSFRALRVHKSGTRFVRRIEEIPFAALPDGEVLVRVDYSSLNYKDGLSATGAPGVTRNYPHTPGIDAAGTVVESSTSEYRSGDEVIVGGGDFGTLRWGGLSEYVRVAPSMLTPLPSGLTPREAMTYGTAGFTAALCVDAVTSLRGPTATAAGREPGGSALVTGATGGVGSFAVAFLSAAGFRVTAVTGKSAEYDFLRSLGAKDIMSREEATDTTGRPLLPGRWQAVVDTVGGSLLATAIRSSARSAIVAACGNAGGADLALSVYPFILRGVTLTGIDSALVPQEMRRAVWSKLAGDWRESLNRAIAIECPLSGLGDWIGRILAGEVRGQGARSSGWRVIREAPRCEIPPYLAFAHHRQCRLSFRRRAIRPGDSPVPRVPAARPWRDRHAVQRLRCGGGTGPELDCCVFAARSPARLPAVEVGNSFRRSAGQGVALERSYRKHRAGHEAGSIGERGPTGQIASEHESAIVHVTLQNDQTRAGESRLNSAGHLRQKAARVQKGWGRMRSRPS